YRVEQVMAGKPHSGQMAAELLAELDELTRKAREGPTNNPHMRAEYAIGRMRQQSRILEPQERLDPYSFWTKASDPLKKELTELHAVREPGKLADRIRRLYRGGVQGKTPKGGQFPGLPEALPWAPRVGETFTVDLLHLVPAVLAPGPGGNTPEPPDTPKQQGELLERSMFQAAHFDRREIVQKLV